MILKLNLLLITGYEFTKSSCILYIIFCFYYS